MAAAISGMIAVAAGVAAWLAARRRWELRPPDDDERAELADPIAAILLRHTGASWLSEDMVDATRAAAAAAAYAATNPLRPMPDRPTRGHDAGEDAGDADLSPAPVEMP